jgi:hypothetical protein
MSITNTDRLMVFREVICLVVCLWVSRETHCTQYGETYGSLILQQAVPIHLPQGVKIVGHFSLERTEENFHVFKTLN